MLINYTALINTTVTSLFKALALITNELYDRDRSADSNYVLTGLQ